MPLYFLHTLMQKKAKTTKNSNQGVMPLKKSHIVSQKKQEKF